MKKLLAALLFFAGCANAAEPQIDHTFGPSYLAFSPDAKQLAVAGSDGVKIYESATGKVLETRKGSSFGTYSLAWSLDGKSLAAGGYGTTNTTRGEIIVWRDKSREKRWFTDKSRVSDLRFSSDGKQLWSATAGDLIGETEVGSVRVWEISSGKLLKTLDKYSADTANFASLDGQKLIVCKTVWPDNQRYVTFESTSGKVVEIATADTKGHFAKAETPHYSAKGREVKITTVSGADFQNYQYIVNDTKGKRLVTQDLGGTWGNAQIKFPYVAANISRRYFPGYEGLVKIWKIEPKTWRLQEVATLNRTIAPTQLTSTRNGKTLFIQSNKGILELDATTWNRKRVWPENKVETIQFPSRTLSVSDDGKRIYNNRWLEMVAQNQKPKEVIAGEKLIGVVARAGALSTDGRRLIAPYKDGIGIYDEKGEVRQLFVSSTEEGETHPEELRRLLRGAFSPNDSQVVVAIGDDGGSSEDGLYLFDFNGKLIRRFSDLLPSGLASPIKARDVVFSLDGSQIYAVSYKRSPKESGILLHCLNSKSGAIEKSVLVPQKGINMGYRTIGNLILSPDGKTLALSTFLSENGRFGPRVLLFDAHTLEKKTSLPLGDGITVVQLGKTIAFDSDNNLAILRGQTIEVWNPRTRTIIKSRLLQ